MTCPGPHDRTSMALQDPGTGRELSPLRGSPALAPTSWQSLGRARLGDISWPVRLEPMGGFHGRGSLHCPVSPHMHWPEGYKHPSVL